MYLTRVDVMFLSSSFPLGPKCPQSTRRGDHPPRLHSLLHGMYCQIGHDTAVHVHAGTNSDKPEKSGITMLPTSRQRNSIWVRPNYDGPHVWDSVRRAKRDGLHERDRGGCEVRGPRNVEPPTSNRTLCAYLALHAQCDTVLTDVFSILLMRHVSL